MAVAAGPVHHVRRGDTLWDIAQQYGTTVAALKKENSLASVHWIQIDQVIRIPNTATNPAGLTQSAGPTPPAPSQQAGVSLRGGTGGVAAAARSRGVSEPAGVDVFPVAGGLFNIGYDAKWYEFEQGRAVHSGDFDGRGHKGIDIFAPKGAPVVSPVSGTVRVTTTKIGGKSVTITRGAFSYYLAHLDSVTAGLQTGMTVKAGEQVGTVGQTGNASKTEPHLHFSVYSGRYGRSVDPWPLVRTRLGI